MTTSPLLYQNLPTPAETRLWDQAAVNEFGHPSAMLMETASRGMLHELLKRHKTIRADRPVLIYAGTGNNGGDGIALARHLHELGYPVAILAVKPFERLPSPAREHWLMAQKSSVPCHVIPEDLPAFLPEGYTRPAIIVDAIMGTGLNKPLPPFLQAVVSHINSFADDCHIYAADIPSGLNGLTGLPMPVAVRAHTTVAFEALKPGLAFPHARCYTGETKVCSIGIPGQIKKNHPPSLLLLSPQKEPFIPLTENLHKGSSGKVLVIGGSEGMEGAPVLSALGALRAGGGYVKILCPRDITPDIRQQRPEFLVQGIGSAGTWQASDATELVESVAAFAPHAVVMGMGMGRSADSARIMEAVLAMPDRCPVILDADALFILAHEKEYGVNIQSRLRSNDTLTPHPLEAARLLPESFFETSALAEPGRLNHVQHNRIHASQTLATTFPGPVVLKGAGTLISQRNHPVVLAPFDIPALAVAGSGDVLAGIIGAISARKDINTLLSAIDLAAFGVYLHAKAGEILSQHHPLGHLASEIANAVPVALALCLTK